MRFLLPLVLAVSSVLVAAEPPATPAPVTSPTQASRMVTAPAIRRIGTDRVTLAWKSEGPVRLLLGPRELSFDGGMPTDEVLVAGLQPGTSYEYTIEGPQPPVKGSFRTIDPKRIPFQIVAGGSTGMDLTEPLGKVAFGIVADGWTVPAAAEHTGWDQLRAQTAIYLRADVPGTKAAYRAEEIGPIRFLFMAPEPLEDARYLGYGETQLGWLESELNAARLNPKLRQIFVITNVVPFPLTPQGAKTGMWFGGKRNAMPVIRNRNAFWQLLASSTKVVAVVATGDEPGGMLYVDKDTNIGSRRLSAENDEKADFGNGVWQLTLGTPGAPSLKKSSWADVPWRKVASSGKPSEPFVTIEDSCGAWGAPLRVSGANVKPGK